MPRTLKKPALQSQRNKTPRTLGGRLGRVQPALGDVSSLGYVLVRAGFLYIWILCTNTFSSRLNPSSARGSRSGVKCKEHPPLTYQRESGRDPLLLPRVQGARVLSTPAPCPPPSRIRPTWVFPRAQHGAGGRGARTGLGCDPPSAGGPEEVQMLFPEEGKVGEGPTPHKALWQAPRNPRASIKTLYVLWTK